MKPSVSETGKCMITNCIGNGAIRVTLPKSVTEPLGITDRTWLHVCLDGNRIIITRSKEDDE